MAVTSDRKVKDFERYPVAQQRKPLALDVVIASPNGRPGGRAMSDFRIGAIWIGWIKCPRAAKDHPLLESLVHVRPEHEVTPGAANGAVARRQGLEDVAQRAVVRPPEFVGIGVDHPVGAEPRRRKPGHPRHPFGLQEGLSWLSGQVKQAVPLVTLQNLGRSVFGAM